MKKTHGAFAFILFASLGLACDDNALNTKNTGTGGQAGAPASGGILGSGGAGSGGTSQSSGGTVATGGTIGAGGILATGGRGGSNAGGSALGGVTGAGGATCQPILCIAIACPGGLVPNPDPCGCPVCPVSDAGVVKDSAADTACPALPCAAPLCAAGYQIVTPTCGCPTCVPSDGGTPNALDAAVEKPQAACTGLDECTCRTSDTCAPITEACYCPFPQCGANGACVCGGGKYLGCAPKAVATCTGAKAQVTALCPTLKGATLDGLCTQTNTACITKCLGEVTSCSDVTCTFCESCDCANDRFTQCVATCTSGLTQK